MTVAAQTLLPERDPMVGELVQVRSRRWLVEEVVPAATPGVGSSLVRLACADDDNQGVALEVFWAYEPDRRILEEEGWRDLAAKGFDDPRHFGAFLNTLKWSCVTATDPRLFQAPFRAGIKIDAYQMEPLRKALRLPRVNLFIADDTGLGKTIEAGLIARELLLRKKVKTIVVSAPPSVLEQWKAELEDRFGLVFEILDRKYLSRMRREHGFSVNPWRTHSRFLISHNLLVDPNYADPMRAWLSADGLTLPGSLLILDEAHHAAPASGGSYGIESKFTRAIRDITSRFEHRLFLSATPHNGHSSSFSTLLELLDPYRFTRGVKVLPKALESVMVRRLKEDIRTVQGGFPKRKVERVVIDGLPDDAPELVLSRLLDQYRTLREKRFDTATKKAQASAGLLVVGLQQRLLSSIEAFARSLKRHRDTAENQWQRGREKLEASGSTSPQKTPELFPAPPSADDERDDWSEEALEAEEQAQIEAMTLASDSESPHDDAAAAIWQEEQKLLDRMQAIADEARHVPDPKVLRLLDWIRDNLCPGLPAWGEEVSGAPPEWNPRRVLIFTESREGTKRYLKNILEQAIDETDQAEDRIAVIDGLVSSANRKEIQRRFNQDPAKDPLRILLATDAAREGLNFQAHCTDLFHFDLPWNPGRLEQRNGRIDRKLQPAAEVRCHYFVLPQRVEDRVLDVLVRKTETIKKELGSLSKVIDDDIERRLSRGIRHKDAEKQAQEIEQADLAAEKRAVTEEELEAAREREEDLKQQIATCQNLLERSREWVGFEAAPFREALSCSLEILGHPGLSKTEDEDGRTVWTFPPLDRNDATWSATFDTLRTPRPSSLKLTEWRKEAPIRPVVFEDAGVLTDDTVHLHLEQRVAQRLLARFRSQGFIHHDLSRSCVSQASDSIPRVILLGRLSLYGQGAERLHEEVIPLTARWVEPSQRKGRLSPYAREAESKTLSLLDEALKSAGKTKIDPVIQKRLQDSSARDIEDLRPQLEPRAQELAEVAIQKLRERGEREEKELRETLERQMKRVQEELTTHENKIKQGLLKYPKEIEERRQLEDNIKWWRTRLEQFHKDLTDQPARVRQFYEVKARRIEPIGLVYLWPETN
ncbi:MAG: DISARM system SNF2-like helicase DrmD [Planctomycetota bacterium]